MNTFKQANIATRYNWLWQKLYSRHEYHELNIIQQECYTKSNGFTNKNEVTFINHHHLTYINAMILMKSITFDINDNNRRLKFVEISDTLKRLKNAKFYENNLQHLLLFCQMSLLINDIDSMLMTVYNILYKHYDDCLKESEHKHDEQQLIDFYTTNDNNDDKDSATSPSKNQDIDINDSFDLNEFSKLISKANSILDQQLMSQRFAEPRLWYIIAVGLQYKRKFKDSKLSYDLALRLVTYKATLAMPRDYISSSEHESKTLSTNENDQQKRDKDANKSNPFLPIIDCYFPEYKFLQLSLLNNNIKMDIHLLNRISKLTSLTFPLHQTLVLLLTVQRSGNLKQYAKAIEILNLLESHSKSRLNPCSKYNQIAYQCKYISQTTERNPEFVDILASKCEEESDTSLPFMLIMSFVYLNYELLNKTSKDFAIVSGLEDGNDSQLIDKKQNNENIKTRLKQSYSTLCDKLIDTYKKTNYLNECQSSSSFWNNLGLATLGKQKLLASVSFLMKAELINPLDWRICFNLAMLCWQTRLYSRTLSYLLRTEFLLKSLFIVIGDKQKLSSQQLIPIVETLIAITMQTLGDIDGAKKYHLQAIKSRRPLSLINYLIFLHEYCDLSEETKQIKLSLLDDLENCWLKRDFNDTNFTIDLLTKASKLSDQLDDIDSQKRRKFLN